MDSRNNYYILAENKAGLFSEVSLWINSPLDEVEAEARRLAEELKTRVVVAVIVVDISLYVDD